jgi:hypothetical protein
MLALLAALLHHRHGEITDTLVELLISTVHRIGARVDRKVTEELVNAFKRVTGKENILFAVAEASLGTTRATGTGSARPPSASSPRPSTPASATTRSPATSTTRRPPKDSPVGNARRSTPSSATACPSRTASTSTASTAPRPCSTPASAPPSSSSGAIHPDHHRHRTAAADRRVGARDVLTTSTSDS